MPHLILTPGDPTGIGPEITAKALQRLGEFPADLKLTVIGNLKALKDAGLNQSNTGGVPPPLRGRLGEGAIGNTGIGNNGTPPPLTPPAGGGEPDLSAFAVGSQIQFIDIKAGQPGAVAYQAIDTAVKMIADKKADALVTGPISKANLAAAGYKEAGHTEILQKLAREYFNKPDARAEMLFVYKNLRLLLLTRHIPLSEVPKALAQPGAVAGPLKILISFLKTQLKIYEPHIAMLGINPHSGEVGGDEEEKHLKPVIKAVNAIGATSLVGPFAADGFFRTLDMRQNPYDAIVAAYHDQGLIPFKMLAGYQAVNMTIGLPFTRTSVSHGTAEDIVGKDMAIADSMIAALHAALEVL